MSREPMHAHLLLLTAGALAAQIPAHRPPTGDLARWEREASAVTIVRDDWGIPHVQGTTDADAVFGMIYAQAEDDFNRVETNYLNALGRRAQLLPRDSPPGEAAGDRPVRALDGAQLYRRQHRQ